MIDYDNRSFSPVTHTPGPRPVAHYHQSANLVWGEFAGGNVRRGSLTGIGGADGRLHFSYCMILLDGEIVAGFCDSVPDLLGDGRIRLTEHWERFGPKASKGVSMLEEVLPTVSPVGPTIPAERRPGG